MTKAHGRKHQLPDQALAATDTILLALPAGELNDLARRLNATPRKCLGFRTPAEVFGAQLAEINARG